MAKLKELAVQTFFYLKVLEKIFPTSINIIDLLFFNPTLCTIKDMLITVTLIRVLSIAERAEKAMLL